MKKKKKDIQKENWFIYFIIQKECFQILAMAHWCLHADAAFLTSFVAFYSWWGFLVSGWSCKIKKNEGFLNEVINWQDE